MGRFPGLGGALIGTVGGFPKAKALRRFYPTRSIRCS